MSYMPIGPKTSAFAVPVAFASDAPGQGTKFREDNLFLAGAASTTGKIGAVAASAPAVIIACPCEDFPVEAIEWSLAFDNSFSYQYARANSNPLSGTLTLADADPVEADDTFVLNAVTWTAKVAPTAASHEFALGANNAACAVNLAAALAGTYGPGVTATAAAVAATDVITVAATTATILQFAQGSSGAAEIAWVETSKLNLSAVGSLVTGTTTAAWKDAALPTQWLDGWGYGALVVTNGEASTALMEVRANRR